MTRPRVRWGGGGGGGLNRTTESMGSNQANCFTSLNPHHQDISLGTLSLLWPPSVVLPGGRASWREDGRGELQRGSRAVSDQREDEAWFMTVWLVC